MLIRDKKKHLSNYSFINIIILTSNHSRAFDGSQAGKPPFLPCKNASKVNHVA